MFTELSIWLSEKLSRDVSNLWFGFFSVCITLILFTLAISWISYRRAVINPPTKNSVQARLAVSLISLILLFVIVFLQYGISATSIILLVIDLAIIVLLLVRASNLGVSLCIAAYWAHLAAFAFNDIPKAASDLSDLSSFNLSQRVTVVTACDILLMRILLLEVVVCFLTAFTSKFFALSIHPSTEDEPDGIVYNASRLYKKITNPEERSPEDAKKVLEKRIDDQKKSNRNKILAFVLVALIVIPIFISGSNSLTKGTAVINNAYIDYVNEYINDTSLSKDESWFNNYTNAKNNIVNANLRAFNVKTRRYKQSDLLYLSEYSTGAFQQLWAIDAIDQAIQNNESEETVREFGSVFNMSNMLQTAASTNLLSTLSSGRHYLSKFATICVDSFRFYTSFIPLWIFALILLLISIAIGVVFIYARKNTTFEKQGLKDLFLTGHFSESISTGSKIGVGIGAIIGIVILLFANPSSNVSDYVNMINESIVQTGANMMSSLIDLESDSQILEYSSAQKSSLEALIAFEDVDDNYADTHELLCEYAGYTISFLDKIEEEYTSSGTVTKDTISNYLICESYMLQEAFTVLINESVNSIADALPS